MFLKLSGFKFNLEKTTLFDRDRLFKGGSLLAQFQYQFPRYRTSFALNILVHSVYNFIHDLPVEKRSVRLLKFKFVKVWDWLAYSERTTWKKPPCQQSACWCKLVRRYKPQFFNDDSIQILLKLAWIVLLTIQDLYGVIEV